jgi:hypothetical protein
LRPVFYRNRRIVGFERKIFVEARESVKVARDRSERPKEGE